MEVPIDVKDIPLPGEDFQTAINSEINLTGCGKGSADIPGLLDVQTLVDNISEEQLIEEQAAEAIAECTDGPESKEQNDGLSDDEVAVQCEIITETPDDSFVLTLNASDLEESEKSTENVENKDIMPSIADGGDIVTSKTISADLRTETDSDVVITESGSNTTETVIAVTETPAIITESDTTTLKVETVETITIEDESNVTIPQPDAVTPDVDSKIPKSDPVVPESNAIASESTPESGIITLKSDTESRIITLKSDTLISDLDTVTPKSDTVTSVTITSESAKIESESTTIESGSTTIESGSTIIESGSTTIESGSTTIESESTTIESGLTTIESEPIKIESEPIKIESASIAIELDSTTVKPESVKSSELVMISETVMVPESVCMDTETVVVAPESVAMETETVSLTPESVAIAPETGVVESDMVAVVPESMVTEIITVTTEMVSKVDDISNKSDEKSEVKKASSGKPSTDKSLQPEKSSVNVDSNKIKTDNKSDVSTNKIEKIIDLTGTIKNDEGVELFKNETEPTKSEDVVEVIEVDAVVSETGDIVEDQKIPIDSDSNTVYIIEEIEEPIIVDRKDIETDEQKTTVIEVIESEIPKPEERSILKSSPIPKLQLSANQPIKSLLDKKPLVKTPASEKARSIKEEFPNIPCHVLGRNIDNPQEDLVSNGRTPPKPRLGVKVPYRNLTSQIVTRQDIANELIELAAKRNPEPDPPIGGDVFFAKKLTQRLASKLAMKNPLLKKPETQADNISILKSGILGEALKSSTATVKPATIHDNSDLLAILEGDVEVDLAKEVGSKSKDNDNPPVLIAETRKTVTKTNISNTPPKLETPSRIEKSEKKILDPEIERIIALKQLEQFPKRSLRGRNRKQNLHKQVQERESLVKEIELTKNESPKAGEKPMKVESTEKKPIEKKPTEKKPTDKKTNDKKPEEKPVEKKPVEDKTSEAAKKKKPIKPAEKTPIDDDLEPRLSPKKVTKTYSRKDPIVNVPPDLAQIVDEGDETKTLNGESKEETKKPIKTAEKKNKKIKTTIDKEINKPEVTLISKRARIIKKKVIWDPDEVPQRPSISPKKTIEEKPKKKPDEEKNKTDEEKEPVEEKPEEKEEESTLKKKVAKVLTKAKVLRSKKTGKLLLQKGIKDRVLRGTNGKFVRTSKKKLLKKRVKTKMSELDKLLADEGAINMLYNVRSDRKSSKKDVISLDKAQRELESRMKAVREVITMSSSQEDSPKTLRRKSPPALAIPIAPPLRKKSRDSLRSSIQSPPPSPSFIYPRAEASRIIRRHSSSFSSECSTPRRMSLDQTQDKTTDKSETTKPETTEKSKEPEKVEAAPATAPKRKKGVPIYVRKADEKTYKGKQKDEPTKEKLTLAEKRKLNTEMSKNFSQSTEPPRKRTRSSLAGTPETSSSPKPAKTKKVDKFTELTKGNDENQSENEKRTSTRNTYKEISVRRIENLTQIILTPTTTKIKNSINLQMFNELCEILMKLSKDETCRVVLISSTDNYFCNGIDFSSLMHANADKRLSIAQDTAKAVKDFLMTLALFPKPLVAGVQGPAVGLGVTMLPLFDLVLASDKATFATPYVKLGHIPEGAVLLASPHINGSVLTSELLFACRKLTASEALQHGLVTRVLWPDKFQEELIPIAKAVSKQSSQCMIATKRVLRKSLLADLQNTLDEETKLLIEQWTSSECQQNFKKLLQENEWW